MTVFKFLAALDRHVRTHRFITTTGRKVTLKPLLDNGLMVHCQDTNYELPVLEPTPLILNSGKKPLVRKLAQFRHFFKSTRIRRQFRRFALILGTALLLLIIVHLSIVRVDFVFKGNKINFKSYSSSRSFFRHTTFNNYLLGNAYLYMKDLSPEHIRRDYDDDFTLYLFKYNWLNSLQRKLDDKGKIILLGNHLGLPFNDIPAQAVLKYALEKPKTVFYWHIGEIENLMVTIQVQYNHFDDRQKKAALELLAQLGKKGIKTANAVFNLEDEPRQELKDLYLKHFHTPKQLAPIAHRPQTKAYRSPETLYRIDKQSTVKPSPLQQLKDTQIPYTYTDGIPYLRACEKLPHPLRETMLVKICRANIDETFKLNADIALGKHYPQTFIKMAYQWRYHQKWDKKQLLVQAYHSFEPATLKHKLRFSLKYGVYGAIYFISVAIKEKVDQGKLAPQFIKNLLLEFDLPVERMLLADLRYYLHKRRFQE